MRLLLDTHVFLWALMTPEKLLPATRAAIESPRNRLYVSAASAWEAATKARLGRLVGAEAAVEGFRSHIRRLGASELPITVEHALLAGRLSHSHRDPFDRMLAAQAMLEGLILVTADPVFTEMGVSTLWG